ncbi:hypothetical protein D6D19_02902 [Aureobasidium pullulans]|uniref:J domain-containing protein n=1 Tax=Aureobasidium pullulans TaxID=5580 RepID=A0A4S9ABU7_AURPU|nr:hypothetical protein D6D19_02902 [Aureobasidium pullulans]
MARILGSVLLLVLCLVALVSAWSPEDHEIFRLQDEVAQHEGSNVTFYSFLGVKPFASIEDVNAAYKKKARVLHPDKARQRFIATYDTASPVQKAKKGEKPTVHVHKNKKPTQKEINAFGKEASARFARLGIVTNILRGPERQRYDHFLRNGFPKWRGTGYYYQRFRPGFTTVMLSLFVFIGGGVHYVVLYMNYIKHRDFVDRYIRHARRAAWGDDIQGIANIGNSAPAPVVEPQAEEEPQAMNWNRKEKRAAERESKRAAKQPKSKRAAVVEQAKNSGVSTPVEAELTSGGPVGAKKRTQAENGKILIVDSVGNVFLEERTEEGELHEYLLDVNEIQKPTFNDTWLVRGPIMLYNKSLGTVLGKKTSEAEMEELLEGTEESEGVDEATATLKSAAQPNANAESRKRKIKPNKQRSS